MRPITSQLTGQFRSPEQKFNNFSMNNFATKDDLRSKANDWELNIARGEIRALQGQISNMGRDLTIANNSLANMRAGMERLVQILEDMSDMDDDQLISELHSIRQYL